VGLGMIYVFLGAKFEYPPYFFRRVQRRTNSWGNIRSHLVIFRLSAHINPFIRVKRRFVEEEEDFPCLNSEGKRPPGFQIFLSGVYEVVGLTYVDPSRIKAETLEMFEWGISLTCFQSI